MKRLLALSLVSSSLLLVGCPSTGIVCSTGTTRCGNGCNDITTDSRNCGACGQACFGSQVCVSGSCLCRSGTDLCNGSCVPLPNDPKNCGMCGHACATGEVCNMGQCAGDCSLGQARCGFSCIDTQADPMNCGACGNACPDSQSCHAGACQWDLVAACFSTGQVVGVQTGSDQRGPLQPLGSGPISLAQYGNTLLAADSIDNRLTQAHLPGLTALSEFNVLGNAPNQVVTDPPYAYVVNSVGHTVQVLGPVGDAGCPAVVQPDAGCAYATFDDGGAVLPLGADGGCFYPQSRAADAGCADTQLADGGLGPLVLDDAGCFAPPPPPPPPMMPCFQSASDAGLKLLTVGELDTGAGSFPQGLVKANGALWVPLFGGKGSVLKVDVTNPANPHTVGTVDFSTTNLHAFDGGMPVARPYGVSAAGGKVYVTLNNLNEFTYVPEGPGLVAAIDTTTLMPSIIDLGGSVCLNPVAAAVDGARLYVSCAGLATYHPPEFYLLSTERSGVVMVDLGSSAVRATWSPQCPGDNDGGCMPILPSRLVVRGGRLYLGDQNGGRIFVADVADGGFTERRGYGAGAVGPPIQACGIDPIINASNVADIISLP